MNRLLRRRSLLAGGLLIIAAMMLACGGAPVKQRLPLVTYQATMPDAETEFILDAQLDDFYNYSFAEAKKTHYSVNMADPESGKFIHGYVEKNSPEGKKILSLLSDGQRHRIRIVLQYRDKASGSVASIVRVSGD